MTLNTDLPLVIEIKFNVMRDLFLEALHLDKRNIDNHYFTLDMDTKTLSIAYWGENVTRIDEYPLFDCYGYLCEDNEGRYDDDGEYDYLGVATWNTEVFQQVSDATFSIDGDENTPDTVIIDIV